MREKKRWERRREREEFRREIIQVERGVSSEETEEKKTRERKREREREEIWEKKQKERVIGERDHEIEKREVTWGYREERREESTEEIIEKRERERVCEINWDSHNNREDTVSP